MSDPDRGCGEDYHTPPRQRIGQVFALEQSSSVALNGSSRYKS
jgi:hypothetical protein